jgi:uncharacterized protein (DUF302 family)
MNMNRFIVEQKSPFGMDKTVEQIIINAKNNSWNIPFIHDLQQSIAKSGKKVKPVKVIELCKPEYSGKMLELNDERIISVMMPCRISVYEKDDGKTYIALINSGLLTIGMPDTIAQVMKSASDETFEIVKSVIDKG